MYEKMSSPISAGMFSFPNWSALSAQKLSLGVQWWWEVERWGGGGVANLKGRKISIPFGFSLGWKSLKEQLSGHQEQ